MAMHKQAYAKRIVFLIILLASTGIVTGYAATLQSASIPLEVEEPLEILPYNSSLSLFPGETLRFNVDVKNYASVTYNASLVFSLNDTTYQRLVSFSDCVYTVAPGINRLEGWLLVSATAPAAKLELIVGITRDVKPPSGSSEPAPLLALSAKLFTGGARWAAGNGTSVLYINWFDNYCAHHFSDGVDWGPYWREGGIGAIKNSMVRMLEQQGFIVTCTGDVPNDLSCYDIVVFEAWFAIEPKHVQQVRDYLTDGGDIVVLGGAPCYFSTYCKDMWPYKTGGQNLTALQDWFGSAYFVNSGGTASLAVDKPFDTLLENQSQVYHIDAYGCYALTAMSADSKVLARWEDGTVFAFTHEYGAGRVYYRAELDW